MIKTQKEFNQAVANALVELSRHIPDTLHPDRRPRIAKLTETVLKIQQAAREDLP